MRTRIAVSIAAALTLGILAPADAALASTDPASPLVIRELIRDGWAARDLAPGDATEWAVDVTNTGPDAVPLSVAVEIVGDGAIVTEPVNGLQLVVELCPVTLTVVDSVDARRFRCDADPQLLASGPAAGSGLVDASAPLGAGDTVGIRIGIRFPSSAGNEFENTGGGLSVRFAIIGDGGTEGPVPGAAEAPQRDAGLAPQRNAGLASLPFTGADVFALLVGAAAAAAAGSLLLIAAGRRSRRAGGS